MLRARRRTLEDARRGVLPLKVYAIISRFYPRSWYTGRYVDVAGMWIPILSSVSLTSESSASVRSSKGKLQLGEISPIERTQTERRRIVTVTIISRCRAARCDASRTIRRSLSSSPLLVEEDRPAAVVGCPCSYQKVGLARWTSFLFFFLFFTFSRYSFSLYLVVCVRLYIGYVRC